MTGQTLIRQRRQRHELEAFARQSSGFQAAPGSFVESNHKWGCPAANAKLRPILDRLVALVLAAGAQTKPGWVAEIGCHGGLWTEWIALTMKSCHTEPGAPRLKLAIFDDSPSVLESTVEYLRVHCLPEPSAMKICHNGKFMLDGQADLVFAFDSLDRLDLALVKAYCESVAAVLPAGGRFLVTLPCVTDRSIAGEDKSEPPTAPAVTWSQAGLEFADEIRETFESNFTCALDQSVPVGDGPVLFEFIRLNTTE